MRETAPPGRRGCPMKKRGLTAALAVLTVTVLAVSAPSSLVEAWRRGGFYVFSREFIEDIPRRLAGPGRFRFLLQPLIAASLGIRSGRDDARAGRPPFLSALLFRSEQRRELMASALQSIGNLVMMGILLDSLFQWVLLGASYPGAALVVGPVLIAFPYASARTIANRAA